MVLRDIKQGGCIVLQRNKKHLCEAMKSTHIHEVSQVRSQRKHFSYKKKNSMSKNVLSESTWVLEVMKGDRDIEKRKQHGIFSDKLRSCHLP
jgi:hypothetical protein